MEREGREETPGREFIQFEGMIQSGNFNIFMMNGVGEKCEKECWITRGIFTLVTSIAFAPVMSYLLLTTLPSLVLNYIKLYLLE